MSTTPSPLAFDALRWEQVLADTARRHQVPGIVAGVLRIDPVSGIEQRFVASTGVTNTRTRVESTRDTMCQIGSITKVVTATMIMQLREEGKLDLDTPITEILTDLKLASTDASTITIKHLLTHTSGIDGDVFTDTGRGDDCLEKYVTQLTETHSLFAPGTGWSYCNSGWVLAGRIIEVLDERTWNESLKARVSERLDLQQFLTLPEEIMSYRYQHGHVREPGKRDWMLAPVSSIARSMGPAGLITSSTDDLLDFGAAFLRGGRGVAGDALLSAESVQLMAETHVTLDSAADAAAPRWGLGWMLDDWNGHRVYWHGGTTIGNKAWLQVLPDDGLAIVVFCNGGVAEIAGPEIFGAFAQEFASTTPSEGIRPVGPASEATIEDSLLGRYADFSTSLEVLKGENGVLQARATRLLEPKGATPELMELLPAGAPNRFAARADDLSSWTQLTFTVVDGVQCAYVDIRCLRKQDDQFKPTALVGEALEGHLS